MNKILIVGFIIAVVLLMFSQPSLWDILNKISILMTIIGFILGCFTGKNLPSNITKKSNTFINSNNNKVNQ
ncbi:hypothetical protein [Fusobacterium hominis]|uniref:hypothetical protein n=1 Tax=Fusobacterium hominis TaxID=2764326 RepID=UPI0022E564B8|nr:hypothetical protein [Fusobacterium hominis]